MVQTAALPSPLIVVAGFLSAGTTHIYCSGPGFGAMSPCASGQVLKRSGGFSWTTGGDNHKLQVGDSHHHQPRAHLTLCMARQVVQATHGCLSGLRSSQDSQLESVVLE